MRRATLSDLIEEVKAEIGAEASSRSNDNGIRQSLKRTQRKWWLDFRPSFLDIKVMVNVPAGTQYIDLPDKISYEGMKQLYLKFGDYYYELNEGVEVVDYSYRDSFADERSYPVLSWQRYERETTQGEGDDAVIVRTDGIELHPIPAVDVDVVFDATKNLNPFEADTDRSTLDGTALALSVAGELLIRSKQNDGYIKVKEAKKMMEDFNQRNDDGRPLSFNRGNNKLVFPMSHLTYLRPPNAR